MGLLHKDIDSFLGTKKPSMLSEDETFGEYMQTIIQLQ